MANKIILKSQGTSGKINITTDASQYWSQKSREWAISDELVDREDYSSKYYAKKSKEAIDDIEASKGEFDNLYNTYTENITIQGIQALENITAKKTESIANIEASAQTEIDKINNEGTTQITNIQNEAEKQLTNLQQNGPYMRDGHLYYIDKNGEEQEFKSGGDWGTITGDLANQTDLSEALALKADKTELDGDWVISNAQVVQSVAIGANSNVTVDLSNFLPEDGDIYECIFNTFAITNASGVMEVFISSSETFYTVIRHTISNSPIGNSNLVIVKKPFSIQLGTTSISTPVTIQELRLSAYRRVH